MLPLPQALHHALEDDETLRELRLAAYQHATRHVRRSAWAQRREIAARLRRASLSLPRRLRPAGFAGERPDVGTISVRTRNCDRLHQAAAHLLMIRERKFAIVAGTFSNLRGGELAAVGQLPCGLTIDVPAELWSASNIVVDTRTGGVSCDSGPLFVGVDVRESDEAGAELPHSDPLPFAAVAA